MLLFSKEMYILGVYLGATYFYESQALEGR